MTALQLFILALVQGITEFLPISSSGHLILIPALTGWADQGAMMDVAVHVGTLTAVLLYFRQDTKGLTLAGLGSIGIAPARRAVEGTLYMKLFWGLIIGTIPMVIVGGLMVATGVNDMLRTAEVIAFTSIFFGILLYIADKKGATEKTMERMAIKPALMIGVAQVFALIPGTSRAGVTMTMARYLGFTRQEAARFSMLLSIPAIIASGAATALDAFEETSSQQWIDAGIAAGLACLTALAAIHFLMKWLERANMTIFVVYRVLLGIILFGLIGAGYIG
ncbi:undecaprenyl-diphosphate phosphatase [Kordiimonas sp. SCSIO 12603]|uniref:undecaprenyl-diphosphate phosphatase n=1 Tax=Kordiimonas sp. SCSIO 12603 TaxID=2829596 RepID=UPI002107E1A8|nr:undecaprenyl-diphosphate phosphatase [Kordiimonas sp. SCSIO 12603]UTW59182.1 undecaprenyl-diphosphate phosphatase [Kordiimonas sp. SCSIO 12603]